MKFATLADGTLDGKLLVVSKDARTAVDASAIAPDLIGALQRWEAVHDQLQALYDALNAGNALGVQPFAPEPFRPETFRPETFRPETFRPETFRPETFRPETFRPETFRPETFRPEKCAAPLPRSPQWLDASAFLNHSALMDRAFDKDPIPNIDVVPLMYQGASDDFIGPHADVPFCSEADGIDCEGEYGVIVGPVPMAATPEQALAAVRLVVQINDWSLRVLGPYEMKTGFGFIQAKPSTSFAPLAVTPDELGDAWITGGRVALDLHVAINGERLGTPNGREMGYGFGQLVAHAARTRRLTPGCIIGSGTVSNANRSAGSACLAERRGIEIIEQGGAKTPYLRFGDMVTMASRWPDGTEGPFGRIAQRVVQA